MYIGSALCVQACMATLMQRRVINYTDMHTSYIRVFITLDLNVGI